MIIDTSFAPSPIARVIHFPLDLKIATMSAFYLGDTLQQITDLEIRAAWKNILVKSLSSINKAKAPPSIAMT
jgi:hypothetical protein